MIGRILELVPEERKERLLSGIFWKLLENIKFGSLTVSYQGETQLFGQAARDTDLHAKLSIHTPKALLRTITGGSIGAGEAYMEGEWSSPDLSKVMQIFFRNSSVMDGMEKGLARFSTPVFRLLHWLNKNSLNQARRNISAHYDLGNDFFKTFLDPTMMYSSAIFENDAMSLEEASLNKLDRICRKLRLTEKDHLIEIGTGWGSMAIYAAKHYGCRVTTTTISRKQYEYTKQRITKEGLEERITLLMEDYRNLTGTYDKLVSIEMIEAVGHHFLDTYFKKCSSLLKPDGLMLIQAITVKDQRYEYARDNSDFIKKYIFPGGFLPSIAVIAETAKEFTDLQMIHMEQFGRSYAKTLNTWKRNFFNNLEKVDQMGYPIEFRRMWDYYLSSCEGGFLEHLINCAQLLFEKPENRQAVLLGKMA